MAFDPEHVTLFAETDARGKRMPFGIKAKDRQKHMYVIGKTGMGKSTMLENMAVQDIQNGEGIAFIDPHGSTAEKLLDFIPEHRMKDVLYFAPHDMEFPISFNIMEDVGADKRHLVVSGLMSVFEKIWVDAWSARMAYILQNTLMALLEYPDSTLMSVNRMLADKEYRKKVVENVTDPSVKSFWVDEFAGYTERFAAEATPAIQNKIGQFTSNPVIRNVIGQPKSSFDIRKLMDEKKILIMNLSKGLIGESNANLLGSMLTTRIYLAAMSRADLPAHQMEEMPNFYFYVDEFQSFANATFANILSEARKYKLNLTIAHQYIEQMEEEVKNAVFGNVGTIISFRVGPFDAEVLETIFAPRFTATDIVNLGFAQIYLTLMIDGIGSQPFSAVTLAPIESPHISYKDMVLGASREQFGHPRSEVEAAILAFHAPTEKPKPPAKQERQAQNNRENGRGTQGSHGGQRQQNDSRRSNDRNTSNRTVDQRRQPRESRERAPEKSLEDLRSTLRSIVGAEKKESSDAPKDVPKRNGDGNRNERGKDDRQQVRETLHKALESALKDQKKEAPKESKPQKQEARPPREPESKEVSAKELERMMRVTTSDKPPL